MTHSPDLVEQPIAFPCREDVLIGIVASGAVRLPLGVVIVVGGPQYRAGSHRQFVGLARHLALAGFPTIRFDYRGMGDSSGDHRSFDTIDDDIRAAIDTLLAVHPTVTAVALWGLCDAASAVMMYSPDDARVRGLVLANPWARGEETYARTQLKYYYARRLFSGALWRKILLGRLNFIRSASEVAGKAAQAVRSQRTIADYRERMLVGLRSFRGRVLLVISGQDLTAREFLDFAAAHPSGGALTDDSVARLGLPEADHTFSQCSWQQEVEEATGSWLVGLASSSGATNGWNRR